MKAGVAETRLRQERARADKIAAERAEVMQRNEELREQERSMTAELVTLRDKCKDLQASFAMAAKVGPSEARLWTRLARGCIVEPPISGEQQHQPQATAHVLLDCRVRKTRGLRTPPYTWNWKSSGPRSPTLHREARPCFEASQRPALKAQLSTSR